MIFFKPECGANVLLLNLKDVFNGDFVVEILTLRDKIVKFLNEIQRYDRGHPNFSVNNALIRVFQ